MSGINIPKGFTAQSFMELVLSNLTRALSFLTISEQKKLLTLLGLETNLTATLPTGNFSINKTEVILNSTSITIIKQADFSGETLLIKFYAYLIILISIIGILGNSLVIGVYSKMLKDLNICKMLILHLAISDLIFALLQIVMAAPSLQVLDWPYGEVGCKSLRSAVLLGSLITVGIILIIAMERYLAIVHCMKFSTGKQRVGIILGFLWISAIASIVPSAIAARFDLSKNDCEEQWNHDGLTLLGAKVYEIYLLVVWFLLPMFLMGFFYSSIINLLRKPLQKRGFENESNSEFVQRRRKEDLRVVKTLVAVVVIFFICCLPIRVMWIIIRFFDVNKLSESSYFALLYSGLLPYPLHVAVNPLVYTAVDKIFRNDVRTFFFFVISPLTCKSTVEPSINFSKDPAMQCIVGTKQSE